MQLISRRDASLATALVISALVLFHQPLRSLLNAIEDVEVVYQLDLLPALLVLVVTFAFLEYQKRQQDAEKRRLALARLREVERLLVFGAATTATLDRGGLCRELCRGLPAFIGDRHYWLLTLDGERWVRASHEPTSDPDEGDEQLEIKAAHAVRSSLVSNVRTGVEVDGDICYPLLAGSIVYGALGVINSPRLSRQDRDALATALTFVALTARNIHVVDRLRLQGRLDELTTCLNRAAGLDALRKELNRARRTRCPLSILMVDIDHFKRLNDSNGHLYGDEVLRWFGARLAAAVRMSDIRCRYGGDEFLVVLPDTPSIGAKKVAEKIRQTVETGVAADLVRPITLSIGVAVESGEFDLERLIARADAALYQAKERGRNRVRVADDGVLEVTEQPSISSLTMRTTHGLKPA